MEIDIRILLSHAYTHLYCSHSFLEANNSDSDTTQVRKSVIHAKYFHLPIKVLRSHKGLSTSNLSLIIAFDYSIFLRHRSNENYYDLSNEKERRCNVAINIKNWKE